MTTTPGQRTTLTTPAPTRPAGLPRHTCDSCRRRPGTWHARFDDGIAFDVCDDCVALVDDRVTLTRAEIPGYDRRGDRI